MTFFRNKYELKGAEKFLKETEFISGNWRLIRRKSSSETVSDYQGKVYDQIASRGRGTWPDFHPLSQQFAYNRKFKSWSRRSRFLGRANYNWLMQMVGSRVNRSGTFSRVRFGKLKTGRNPDLEERAIWLEQGHKTKVNDDMRRLWGATRDVHKTSLFLLKTKILIKIIFIKLSFSNLRV